ncbi:protein of unknown function [Cardinium endosymbiont cEper1 of Encarsia pergandiella]|nr:protein of unknown function [Cardinium endosymbiont cEper1 of Encarsia pergandiella]
MAYTKKIMLHYLYNNVMIKPGWLEAYGRDFFKIYHWFF